MLVSFVAARRARVLVVVPVPLVDLDNRLEFGVVVAPVGAHGRGAGVGRADRAKMLQVGVQHLGVGRALVRRPLQIAAHQRPNAALRHHDVAMAVGVDDAPFVGHGRDEAGRMVDDVGHFLDLPPHVLAAVAVVVVAVAHPVQVPGVQGVAPAILEQAVDVAVGAVLGVPVELAAQQLELLAADLDAVGARAATSAVSPGWTGGTEAADTMSSACSAGAWTGPGGVSKAANRSSFCRVMVLRRPSPNRPQGARRHRASAPAGCPAG